MQKETRYHVLDMSLRIEEALADLFKIILRISKPETKTLDNKSSSLSFKAKVDLLSDLNDINKYEYNLFIKFSEIRNQFVHNHDVNEYINLPKGLVKFLHKDFPCKTEQSENLKLACSFDELQAHVLARVRMLIEEYNTGKISDYEKYIAFKQNERIEDILGETKRNFEYAKSTNDFGILINPKSKTDIEIFIEMFIINQWFGTKTYGKIK